MRFRNCAAALMAFITLSVGTATAEGDFPGVRALMSDDEFEASGLDKLSKEELKALDGWLVRYTAGEALVVKETSKEVREVEKTLEVTSRLSSDFTGWEGKTIFRLDNGQVWQQRLDGRYRYRGPANPEVRISRNWLGFYQMTLVEENRSVGVTRRR